MYLHSTETYLGQNLQQLIFLDESQHHVIYHWHFKRNIACYSLIFPSSISGNRKLARKDELMGEKHPKNYFLLPFIKRTIM